MAFRIDLAKYQPLYTPLAIFAGCLVIAAAIYGSGGITIGGSSTSPETSEQEETGSPTVAGESLDSARDKEAQTEYDQATLDRFAKCLKERGAKLYAASWCPHCAHQKELFGSSVQYLNHIECAEGSGGFNQTCIQAGIEGVPTWIFKDGSRATGVQTLEALSKKTGCPLE